LSVIQGFTQELANPYDVQVVVRSNDGRFHVKATYTVPMNACAAFAFITDYEGAKKIPGIIESKVTSRAGDKVLVHRVVQERILFIPIELQSLIEYTEVSDHELIFEQISGDTKMYKGTWNLSGDKGKTVFKYESVIEPNSIIPSAVIEYFMKNSIQGRFEAMAQRASQAKNACN